MKSSAFAWVAAALRAFHVVLFLFLATPVMAQLEKPPMRLVVPTPAGGPLDLVGRVFATALARESGEPVIVENRPGANGLIGTEAVARSRPDGRTILLAAEFVASNVVMSKADVAPLRDLAPVIELMRVDLVVVVRKSLGVREPSDLQRAAAQQPGGLNCAAPPGGLGLACEQLKLALGPGSVVTVPYAGVAPAMNALLGGQVDIAVVPYDAVAPQLETGLVVAVASAGPEPAGPPFEKLPRMMQFWPSFTVVGFMGVMVPAGTPPATIAGLNRAFNNVLKDPQVRDALRGRGRTLKVGGSPGEFSASIAERIDYYRRLADAIGLKPQ